MTDERLDRELRSIGKAAFVEHFELFASMPSKGRPSECLDELIRLGRSENLNPIVAETGW